MVGYQSPIFYASSYEPIPSLKAHVVQLAPLETSPVVIEALNAFPPTIWCICGEGNEPGLTSGSSLSMTT